MTGPRIRFCRPVRLGLGLLLWASLLPAAWAEKADHDKPTNILYDSSDFDDLHQIYVFRGHVVLTKGTILIRCDKLVVTRDPENYEYGTATMDEPGRLVYFHQKREGFADQYIEGVGERIEYDEKADLAKIFVKAVVRRLDGGELQDEIRGEMIQYNSLTEKYVVQSGGNGNRAHAEFAPAKSNAPPPAAGTAPGSTSVPGSTANPGAQTGPGQTSSSSAASPSGTAPVPTPDPGAHPTVPVKPEPTPPLQPSLELQNKPQ